jgi:hypothetical protein
VDVSKFKLSPFSRLNVEFCYSKEKRHPESCQYCETWLFLIYLSVTIISFKYHVTSEYSVLFLFWLSLDTLSLVFVAGSVNVAGSV